MCVLKCEVFVIFGVAPSDRKIANLLHLFLKFLDLLDECVAHGQSFDLEVQKVQTFIQAPVILFHKIGQNDNISPRASFHGVYEHSLTGIHGLIDKFHDNVDRVVPFVEDLIRLNLLHSAISRSSSRKGTVCHVSTSCWGSDGPPC